MDTTFCYGRDENNTLTLVPEFNHVHTDFTLIRILRQIKSEIVRIIKTTNLGGLKEVDQRLKRAINASK